MNDQQVVDRLNASRLAFITMMGGSMLEADPERMNCTMEFNISRDFCHSVDVVQGGFVTAMLDAAMSHAVFAVGGNIVGVSSLEIKTSFLEPTRAGKLRAVGEIIKSGYKVAFMEGRLYDEHGLLTATASTVAKLVRQP
jgi:uncharacterized protein (TIGR00369 family)